MRVFLDANVLFAAAISPEGRAAALFSLAEPGSCILLASAHAVTEARRNLEARYPRAVSRFERLLRSMEIVPEAPEPLVAWARGQLLPEEDAPILAAAVEARADILVTGDKTHYRHLFEQVLRGVRVLRTAPLPRPAA